MAQRNLNILVRLDLMMVKQSISGLRSGLNLLKSSLKAVFRTGIVAGFFAVLRAGFGIVNNFKNGIKMLGAEFLQLRLKAAETASILSKGGDSFSSSFESAITLSRELSTQMGFSAQQIQEGLITAARSGLDLQGSLQITGSAMKLATSNGAEFQDTLNNLIGVSRAFGVELSALPVFADQLSTAVVSSNVSLGGLFEGLKNVASVASVAFGETRQTVIDTTAALMTLNDAGIQGAKAGTRLRAAMQKLMGGTAQTTAAFTKYGVNIFQADGTSQKFLGTLTKGQKALAGYTDKLNDLKSAQFDMVSSGEMYTDSFDRIDKKYNDLIARGGEWIRSNLEQVQAAKAQRDALLQSGEAYKKGSKGSFSDIQAEIDNVSGSISKLEGGLDDVYEQFTLAGGKLRPFGEMLGDIKSKVPTEVIGRSFGIRGGEAIMRLLNDLDKFQGFQKTIEEATKESERGVSITDNMYQKFIQTVLIGWMRIKNTATGILGEIADGFFSAIQPFLAPIQESLQYIFNAISRNKGAFKGIFEMALSPLQSVMASMQVFFSMFASGMSDILTRGASVTLPELKKDAKSGILSVEPKEVTGTTEQKLMAAMKSLSSAVVILFQTAVEKLKPLIGGLGLVFAEAVSTQLKLQTSLWVSIGKEIGTAIFAAFIAASKSGVANITSNMGFNPSGTTSSGTASKVNSILFGGKTTQVSSGSTEAPQKAQVAGSNNLSGMDMALDLVKAKTQTSAQKPNMFEIMAEIDGVFKNVNVQDMGTSVQSIVKSMGSVNQTVKIMNQSAVEAAALANQARADVASLTRKMSIMNKGK